MKVRISGVPGLEGEYEIANPPFITREWREIKKKTGLLPMDFEEHGNRADPDVIASSLWVTLTRAGKESRTVWAALDEVNLFSDELFSVVAESGDEQEDDAVPPASTPASTDDGNEPEPSVEPQPSGETSPPPLALLGNPPSPTGFPRSATGAV